MGRAECQGEHVCLTDVLQPDTLQCLGLSGFTWLRRCLANLLQREVQHVDVCVWSVPRNPAADDAWQPHSAAVRALIPIGGNYVCGSGSDHDAFRLRAQLANVCRPAEQCEGGRRHLAASRKENGSPWLPNSVEGVNPIAQLFVESIGAQFRDQGANVERGGDPEPPPPFSSGCCHGALHTRHGLPRSSGSGGGGMGGRAWLTVDRTTIRATDSPSRSPRTHMPRYSSAGGGGGRDGTSARGSLRPRPALHTLAQRPQSMNPRTRGSRRIRAPLPLRAPATPAARQLGLDPLRSPREQRRGRGGRHIPP